MLIKDMEGREMPLLDVMKMIFKYLVDHLLQQLDTRNLLKDISPSSGK